jgi:hypothetical protein
MEPYVKGQKVPVSMHAPYRADMPIFEGITLRNTLPKSRACFHPWRTHSQRWSEEQGGQE